MVGASALSTAGIVKVVEAVGLMELLGIGRKADNCCAKGPIPVIGRLPDTTHYAGREGYEIISPQNWSPPINATWIQGHIEAGDTFLLASPVTEQNIVSTTNATGFTVFADEVSQILNAGYQWVGDSLVPGK
jgi:hypothetical protein